MLDEIRCEAWKAASGNPACLSQDLYDMMKFKAKRLQDILQNKQKLDRAGRNQNQEAYL